MRRTENRDYTDTRNNDKRIYIFNDIYIYIFIYYIYISMYLAILSSLLFRITNSV